MLAFSPMMSVTAEVKSRLVLGQVLPLLLEVEIELRRLGRIGHLPGLVADGHESESRGKHHALLGAADHHVDAPLVGPDIMGHEGRDRVNDKERVGLFDDRGKRT